VGSASGEAVVVKAGGRHPVVFDGLAEFLERDASKTIVVFGNKGELVGQRETAGFDEKSDMT
jgi:ribosomal protein S12 methylthiotransferase accessory factor YcaO